MKNILILAKAYPPVVGGVESYSEEVTRACLARGMGVLVITQTDGAAGWSEQAYPEGRVRLFNTGPGGQATVFLRFLRVLRQVLARESFDVMHATTWRPALALWPWRRRCPVVVTVHGREVLNYPFFLKRPMIAVLARADRVVAVSGATMQIARDALFGRQPRGTWRIAFNGISHPDLARSLHRVPLREGAPVRLLTLARHVPRKNIDSCIRALAVLRDEGLRFDYRIGGRGPQHEALRALVRDLGLEGMVTFLGYVPDADLPDLYLQADAFLHPQTNVGDGNDFEGFGLVIADAMSFGCAVLAGEAGGPRDFIRPGETGLLVDGLDQTAVTDAVRRLVTDAALRQALGQAGQKQALSEFSWDRHVETALGGLEKAAQP